MKRVKNSYGNKKRKNSLKRTLYSFYLTKAKVIVKVNSKDNNEINSSSFRNFF